MATQSPNIPFKDFFKDLDVNYFYKLSQTPQVILTAAGFSADAQNNLWDLHWHFHKLIGKQCTKDNSGNIIWCTATFEKPEANIFGNTDFIVDSRHLQNGVMTTFTKDITRPPGAGAFGGAKRNLKKLRKTRKSKKIRKSRKTRKSYK